MASARSSRRLTAISRNAMRSVPCHSWNCQAWFLDERKAEDVPMPFANTTVPDTRGRSSLRRVDKGVIHLSRTGDVAIAETPQANSSEITGQGRQAPAASDPMLPPRRECTAYRLKATSRCRPRVPQDVSALAAHTQLAHPPTTWGVLVPCDSWLSVIDSTIHASSILVHGSVSAHRVSVPVLRRCRFDE